MSVAFRRESDEEHKEPTFEVPIPVGPNLVTQAGLLQIEARVAELEAMVQQGDEASLEEAKRDLRYWRTRLATAQLVSAPPAGQVGIGSRVRFRMDGSEREMHIVGHDEAVPAASRIFFASPLGRALMGAQSGDLIDFAGKAEALEVISVTS